MLQPFDKHPHSWMLNVSGLRELESSLAQRYTTSLMELAGVSASKLALAVAPHAQRFWVAAGPGNNGGDGIETALQLHQQGKRVTVTLLSPPEKMPADAYAAWLRASADGVDIVESLPSWLDTMGPEDLCIDALLGIGASRAPQGPMLQAVQAINNSAARVLALDIPTGLDPCSGQALDGSETMKGVVRADHTLSFLAAKPGLFMAYGRDASGQIWIDTLSPEPSNIDALVTPVAERNPPAQVLPTTHAGHKGTYGDVAVIGGEARSLRGMGMGGAAMMAASAAMNAGAGRVTLTLLGGQPEHLHEAPDLMLRDFDQLELGTLCVVCGCGGGTAVADVLLKVLQLSQKIVLDADALNAIALSRTLQLVLVQRPAGTTVLTPHPKEAARLLGTEVLHIQGDRLQSARKLAQQFNSVVVLKGSGSVIASPDRTPRINTTGNGQLSIGGTGDVLAGLIGARMAQGLAAFDAASTAVWEHGHAADLWPRHLTLTASRLARRLLRWG